MYTRGAQNTACGPWTLDSQGIEHLMLPKSVTFGTKVAFMYCNAQNCIQTLNS